MIKKFNIALLPLTKCIYFTSFSQKFSMHNIVYQLGPHSLPHVTLGQFYATEIQLEEFWSNICIKINFDYICLNFSRFSCKTFDDKQFWISLIPNNLMLLKKLHSKILPFIDNPNIKIFDPHLTLIGTLDKAYKEKGQIPINSFHPISDTFDLSIGECDRIGQYTKTIKLFSTSHH